MSDETVINETAGVVANAAATVADRATERAKLEAEVSRLNARLAALAPTAPTVPASAPTASVGPEVSALLAEYAASKAQERDQARLSAVRAMGFAGPLTEAQLLALAPPEDPRDPAGMAAFESFRQANAALFRPAADPTVVQLRAELEPLRARAGALYQVDRVIDRHEAMSVSSPPRRPPEPFDVDALRSDLSKRSSRLFNGSRAIDAILGPPANKP